MNNLGKLVICLTTLILIALPVAAQDIYPEHPRMMFRADNGGDNRIVTVDMLKERAADPRFEQFHNRLHNSITNYAMRAIAYDDPAAADSAIAMLVRPMHWTDTTWDGIRVLWASFVFDWLYNHPNFDEWEKAMAIDQIVAGARHLKEFLDTDRHIFHTRMYAWTAGLGAAGYALHGHFHDADSWARYANNFFVNQLMPARELLGGSVHNSFGYGRHYIMFMCGHYMSMVYTATGEDLYAKARDKMGDWANREAEFIIYGRQPDGLMAKFGDCYRRTSERFSFRVIAERNWQQPNPVFQGYLNYLLDEQKESVFEMGNDYIAYLYFDPDKPSKPYSTLPKYTMFGQYGTGFVSLRSGWDRNDTWLLFKAGDYFGNHGHFDQGHLGIFRGAPLSDEAGAYTGGFSGENHRMSFYRKSISHNTLLVVDPSIPDDEGGQRIYNNQNLGTIDEYNADLGAEMADLVAYSTEGGIPYLKADLTHAYPGDRVQEAVREVAFVADRYIVVRDRVILARDGFIPKQIWHCPLKPELGKKSFKLERDGGRLYVESLDSANKRLDWIEGFRVGDKVWKMKKTPSNSDPMVGRVEVVSTAGGREHQFVTVLDVWDAGVKEGSFKLNRDGTVSTPAGKLVFGKAGVELK